MSPVFDTRTLGKRWFHMPSFAVIAAAASLGIVGVRAIDAYKTLKTPRPDTQETREPSTTTLIGRASVPDVKPDRVAWSLSIDVSGKRKPDVARELVTARQRIVAQLLAAGVTPQEMRLLDPAVDEDTDDVPGATYDQPERTIVVGYDGNQVLEIQSSRIEPMLAAYASIATAAPPEISVTPPECWLADMSVVRRQLQEAALADIERQAFQIRTQLGTKSLGKPAVFSMSDADIAGVRSTWACTTDHSAQASATATYWVK